MPHQSPELAEIFQFRPWPPWDPVPWWVLRLLDERVIRDLATVQLEAQRAILEVQIKGVEKAIGLIKAGR